MSDDQDTERRMRLSKAADAVDKYLNPDGASSTKFVLLIATGARAGMVSNIERDHEVVALMLDTIAHYQHQPPGNA